MSDLRFIALGDLHIGKLSSYFKNNSETLLDEYFDNFFSYCRRESIKYVVQLGDIFDVSRPKQQDINYFIHLLKRFEEEDVGLWCITGNHDYRYSEDQKSTGIVEHLINLKKFKNIHIYSKPTIDYIEDFPFAFYPFPYYEIPEDKKYVVALHMDINSFQHLNCGVGLDIKNGIPLSFFENQKYNNLYLCGHLHTKQYNKKYPNIYYVGTPYQVSFSDVEKNGKPQDKTFRVVTLTKTLEDFNYRVEEVSIPSSYRLTTIFINCKEDLQQIELASIKKDRLTLKLTDLENLEIPKNIREDVRVHNIKGIAKKNLDIEQETSFVEEAGNIKETLLNYIDKLEIPRLLDRSRLKSLVLNMWKF